MRMLAKLEGGYLHIDRYGPSVAARLEKTNFPLEASELQKLLRILESDGMVASIFERLDGLLYALTAKGRAVMEAEGFIFNRSEEHTSELQSLMRISYAVFCLKKKKETA